MSNPYYQNPPNPPGLPPRPPASPGQPGHAMLTPKRSGMAVTSLILGLVSIPAIFLCIGWLTAFAAIVLGFVSLILISTSKGWVKGKGMAIGGMLSGIAAIGIYIPFLMSINEENNNRPEAEKAAEKAFQVAQSKLSGGRTGGYGDTDLEKEIATGFNNYFKLFHNVSIVTEDASGNQVEKESTGFVTVCSITDQGVVILAKVPEYNDHTDEAKEAVAEMAWSSANTTLEEFREDVPEGTPIVVGLKGLVLYGAVMKGKVGAEEPEQTGTDKDVIEKFYIVEEPEISDEDTTPDIVLPDRSTEDDAEN